VEDEAVAGNGDSLFSSQHDVETVGEEPLERFAAQADSLETLRRSDLFNITAEDQVCYGMVCTVSFMIVVNVLMTYS
jgi:hypothetical protein